MLNRRQFVTGGVLAGAALLTTRAEGQAHPHAQTQPEARTDRPVPPAQRVERRGSLPGGQVPVHMPNGAKLAWRRDGAVKVGHMVVAPFENEFAPGLRGRCWGYNGRTPGPLLEAIEGDRVRIYVTNRLPEPTTVHWHGFILPSGMDGVSGLSQRPIEPGETYKYEFVTRYPGTFMYHSHHDEMTQIALGCVGMFVVHPRAPRGPRVAHDFALMTHEWKIEPGTHRPDPNEMTDFNVFTFNGKSFPSTEPMLVGRGARTRIRLGNLSPMTSHPIHIHGHNFKVTQSDGGYVPESAQHPDTTVIVPVGATRVIEFVSEESGDWAMHCHMTHHVMMQMGHGLPNMVGVDTSRVDPRVRRLVPDYMTMGTTGMGGMGEMRMPMPPNSIPMRGGPGPFSYIDMGGMMTLVKVRDDVATADPAGWYANPAGTVASVVSADELRAAGFDPERAPADG